MDADVNLNLLKSFATELLGDDTMVAVDEIKDVTVQIVRDDYRLAVRCDAKISHRIPALRIAPGTRFSSCASHSSIAATISPWRYVFRLRPPLPIRASQVAIA
jgi:hypothetical protein